MGVQPFPAAPLFRIWPLEKGKEMPLSSVLFLIPEALCPVLVHLFWKECQLVKPVVLKPSHLVSPCPCWVTLFLPSPTPPPEYLQHLHMVIPHLPPSTPTPRKEKERTLPFFSEVEHNGNDCFVAPTSEQAKLWAP